VRTASLRSRGALPPAAIAERSTEDAVQYLRDLARGMADGETMDLVVPDFDHTVAI
jgi:hypothetical protein